MNDDELNQRFATMVDAITKLTGKVDRLAEQVTEVTESVRTTDHQMRDLMRVHADHSADISRLYGEMSEHFRKGHA